MVGSGIAFNLLSYGRIPVWVGCIFTVLDTFTFLAVGHLGVRYLEALVCVMIGTMSACFFFNWAASSTLSSLNDLVAGWAVPAMPSYGITQAIGAVGAVIMPHNLYLVRSPPALTSPRPCSHRTSPLLDTTTRRGMRSCLAALGARPLSQGEASLTTARP